MILGIGIDMVKIEKMRKAVEKHGQSFLDRVFNKEELKPIAAGKMYYQRLSARFAAKEAVIKAVSKKYPLDLTDIIVLNRPNGAPYIKFKKRIPVEIFLSLTHLEDYAAAAAVAQAKR